MAKVNGDNIIGVGMQKYVTIQLNFLKSLAPVLSHKSKILNEKDFGHIHSFQHVWCLSVMNAMDIHGVPKVVNNPLPFCIWCIQRLKFRYIRKHTITAGFQKLACPPVLTGNSRFGQADFLCCLSSGLAVFPTFSERIIGSDRQIFLWYLSGGQAVFFNFRKDCYRHIEWFKFR